MHDIHSNGCTPYNQCGGPPALKFTLTFLAPLIFFDLQFQFHFLPLFGMSGMLFILVIAVKKSQIFLSCLSLPRLCDELIIEVGMKYILTAAQSLESVG